MFAFSCLQHLQQPIKCDVASSAAASWPLFSRTNGLKSKRLTAELHKGPRCMGQQQHCEVTVWQLLLLSMVRKCRKDPSATANLLQLGSASGSGEPHSSMQPAVKQRNKSRLPPFPTQRCSCQVHLHLVLPSLTKCCAAILHRIQISRASLIFANTMAGLINLRYNIHSNHGFWQFALFQDQWECSCEDANWGSGSHSPLGLEIPVHSHAHNTLCNALGVWWLSFGKTSKADAKPGAEPGAGGNQGGPACPMRMARIASGTSTVHVYAQAKGSHPVMLYNLNIENQQLSFLLCFF